MTPLPRASSLGQWGKSDAGDACGVSASRGPGRAAPVGNGTLMKNGEAAARTSMSRRELLQRGAVVGGAVLAAQSVGTVSAYARTSPPPPPPPGEPTGSLPSNFQIVVAYDGVNYGVKYDQDGWDGFGRGNTCAFEASWVRPTDELIAMLAGSVSVGTDDSGHLAYVVSLPDGVRFVEGRPWDGTCQAYPGAHDKCGAPVQPMGDGTLAFAACD